MTTESQPDRARGACLCGAVEFSFALPTHFCGHCHCTMCQRAHGAASVTWIGAPREGFKIDAGEEVLTRFRSSEHVTRSFCSRCGSSMFCDYETEPSHIDVTLANVIDPIDRPPQVHTYFSDRASWTDVRDELPRLGGDSGMEPLKEE